ncbi:thiolase family protein [Roseibium sp. RKSG952]|nr:thiolase family protein [Roseibium sp. RKSG952]
MSGVRMIAAGRTPVVPRGGAFKSLQADELAAPVFKQLLQDAGIVAASLDHVIMGNALYGGGNPARMAALRAGVPDHVPAMTIDTQCCSGLDAILWGARLVGSGAAGAVIAGGLESFSRSPIRMTRPVSRQERPKEYLRPPFAPCPDRDPDLAEAAADLARTRGYARGQQADFAVASHRKAMEFAEKPGRERRLITPEGAGITIDPFSRNLSGRSAHRAPVLSGDGETGLSAATIAVEADAAAAVLLVRSDHEGLEITGGVSAGVDPARPAEGGTAAAARLFERGFVDRARLSHAEVMEAFAPQAMATIEDLAFAPGVVNPFGGALARGHPIGASGAILAVNLFESHRLGAKGDGLAVIAAAGGLGAGLGLRFS